MKKNNAKKKLLTVSLLIIAAIAALFVTYGIQKLNNKLSKEITVQEAQQIVDSALSELPTSVSTGAKYVLENSKVTVNSLEFGTDKNAILSCSYSAPAIGETVSENLSSYLTEAYAFYDSNNKQGIKTNATKIKLLVTKSLEQDLAETKNVQGETVLEVYETSPGEFSLYLSDETVNTVFGGILDAIELIKASDTIEYNGNTVDIKNQNTLRTGIGDCIALKNYDNRKPDTSVPLEKVWNSFKYDFYRNFIEMDRYTYITNGLATTLAITLCAVLLGVLIGFIVAIIRCVNQKTGKLEIFSDLCKIYLAIMRGTPVMVQLLIIYFVVLLPIGVPKFYAAVLCFGLNSGAYVSEIIRGGIMSVDEGQTEAGRSLGFTYMQTMFHIIIPQAFKAVLPALANEFIALLKESSVAFYIGVADLTLGGIKIRSITYSNFMPLIAVAVVYLVVVLGLSKCVTILERRLSKGDKR